MVSLASLATAASVGRGRGTSDLGIRNERVIAWLCVCGCVARVWSQRRHSWKLNPCLRATWDLPKWGPTMGPSLLDFDTHTRPQHNFVLPISFRTNAAMLCCSPPCALLANAGTHDANHQRNHHKASLHRSATTDSDECCSDLLYLLPQDLLSPNGGGFVSDLGLAHGGHAHGMGMSSMPPPQDELNAHEYQSDEFKMYRFKVEMCSKKFVVDLCSLVACPDALTHPRSSLLAPRSFQVRARLENVSVQPSYGERQASRPPHLSLRPDSLPLVQERHLPPRRRLPLLPRSLRGLAPPGQVPHPALQGGTPVSPPGVLLRPLPLGPSPADADQL